MAASWSASAQEGSKPISEKPEKLAGMLRIIARPSKTNRPTPELSQAVMCRAGVARTSGAESTLEFMTMKLFRHGGAFRLQSSQLSLLSERRLAVAINEFEVGGEAVTCGAAI